MVPRMPDTWGAGLAAAAIELGLVDELRMFRYPVVVGAARPPAAGHRRPRAGPDRDQTFGSRVIYERYRRVRDESD
jgi:riboflavin biosynthesis pyrimidine reductase